MILTQKIKTTTSALALTLALISQNAIAMDISIEQESAASSSIFELPASNHMVAKYIPSFSNQNAIDLKEYRRATCGGREYYFESGAVKGPFSIASTDEPRKVIPNAFENRGFPAPHQIQLDMSSYILKLSHAYRGTSFADTGYTYSFTVQTLMGPTDLESIRDLSFQGDNFHGLPAVAHKVFPKMLDYTQMDLLAQGEEIVLEGQRLKAVDPSVLLEKKPNNFKQFGRSTLYSVGLAEEAGAQKIGGIIDSGNIKVQNYLYKPAGNMGTTFQFSVYFEDQHPSLLKGNSAIIERVKQQDHVENIKHVYGDCHPDVTLSTITDKIGMIRTSQLAPLVSQSAGHSNKIQQAFMNQDNDVFNYLSLTQKQIEAELFVVKQKLYFLEVTAPQMLRGDSTLKATDLFKTMEVVANSVFYTVEILEKKKTFEALYPEVVQRAAQYKVDTTMPPSDLPPSLPITTLDEEKK